MTLIGAEFGNVSEWVSGVATVTAVIVALVFSLRTERHQRDQSLASVHAWFELTPPRPGSPLGAGPDATLRLVNNTAYPVYEWAVNVRWSGVDIATSQLDHGLLPPGHHDFALSSDGLDLPENDAAVEVDLRFRDAEGKPRHRLPTGRLVGAKG